MNVIEQCLLKNENYEESIFLKTNEIMILLRFLKHLKN